MIQTGVRSVAVLICLLLGHSVVGQTVVPVEKLLAVGRQLEFRVQPSPEKQNWRSAKTDAGTLLEVPSESQATLWLIPPEGQDCWNIKDFSYFRGAFENRGSGMVVIEMRLDCSPQSEDWKDSAMSLAFALPGENVTVGVAYPASGNYSGPKIFSTQSAKPNGFRKHWRQFQPEQVQRIRIKLRTEQSPISVCLKEIGVGFPLVSQESPTLFRLPYLDRFGQVKNLRWPGKLLDETELPVRLSREGAALANDPNPGRFNQWGGSLDGPQLKATGYFRTQKIDGRWWFVDPEGRLFWSHGCDTIGFGGTTPINQQRQNLFSWLPNGEAAQDPEFLPTRKGVPNVSFPAINLQRKFGQTWKRDAADQIHRRFRSWGMNTLGAWSNRQLELDRRTPYAHVIHLWGPYLDSKKHFPNPFDPQFRKNTAAAIQAFRKTTGDDPWCLGIFLDNEVDWKEEIVPMVLAGRKQSPAKRAFVRLLRQRYQSIDALNLRWKTEFESWEGFAEQRNELVKTKSRTADFDWLMKEYARAYYQICHDRLAEIFPNHLYLGSRIHSCPWPVSHAAAEFVDVYSINHYWFTTGLGTMPKHVDKPFMVTEFHFGALDRGVPGPSLVPVHNQQQRARAYLQYVASGLQHPQCVGTHWFAYLDQSAVGRPGENYNIGLVDVTDTPHQELVNAVRAVGRQLYSIRWSASTPKGSSLEATVSQLVQSMDRLDRLDR